MWELDHKEGCCCLVAESWLTLCNSIVCSPPGSSFHGILQIRTLEWVAITFPKKKAEHWRIGGFKKTLESPLDCKEIKPVNFKRNQLWIVIEKTDAEAEVPILWPPDMKNWPIGKDPDAGKERQKEKRVAEDKMVIDSITDSMDMNLSKLGEMVKDKEVWLPQSMWSQSWTWLSKWIHTLI